MPEWTEALDLALGVALLAAAVGGTAFVLLIAIEWRRIRHLVDIHEALGEGLEQEWDLARMGIEVPSQHERLARAIEKLLARESVLAPPPAPGAPPPAQPPSVA